MEIEYAWNVDNTISARTENDYTSGTLHTAIVAFGHDGRKRLTAETRIVDGPTTVYAFSYAYDQLGNRTLKRDTLNSRRTEYTYDTDLDPNDPNGFPDPHYVTRNNRLLYYKEYNALTGGDLVRTVSYQYLANGNPGHIIVKDEYTKYYALRLAYASNRRL